MVRGVRGPLFGLGWTGGLLLPESLWLLSGWLVPRESGVFVLLELLSCGVGVVDLEPIESFEDDMEIIELFGLEAGSVELNEKVCY